MPLIWYKIMSIIMIIAYAKSVAGCKTFVPLLSFFSIRGQKREFDNLLLSLQIVIL